MGVSLHRDPTGEAGEDVNLQGNVIVEGGIWKWSISLYGSLVRETWRHTRRLCRWAPLSIAVSLGNLVEGSYAGRLCIEEGSGTSVYPYRGPVGKPGEGGLSTGNFEN